MGESTNAIRKELNHLYAAGYLQKSRSNNKIHYRANTKHPLFDVLQKVVMKHLGLEDIVSSVLERMGAVKQIVLVGEYAKGIDSGNIEVFLVGETINTEYITQLEIKIQNLIDREVHFYLTRTFIPNQKYILLYEG